MKPIRLFFLISLGIALILFLFPINLFDGEVVVQNGSRESVEQAPLSLSYFVGMGYDPAEMDGIKNFYLLPTGYLMAFIFIIGIPFLVAYRVYLSQAKKNKE